MIVYACHIITDDGRTIFTEYFMDYRNLPDSVLLGGFLTAFQAMFHSIGQSEISTITIEGFSYNIKSFGLVRICLVTDIPSTAKEKRQKDGIIQKLGLRFVKEYGYFLTLLDISLNIFDSFKTIIFEVLGQDVLIDQSQRINPIKKLTTAEIFSLPTRIHATALAMISISEGTTRDIAIESRKNLETTKKNITYLQKQGFIGVRQVKGKKVHFCSL